MGVWQCHPRRPLLTVLYCILLGYSGGIVPAV